MKNTFLFVSYSQNSNSCFNFVNRISYQSHKDHCVMWCAWFMERCKRRFCSNCWFISSIAHLQWFLSLFSDKPVTHLHTVYKNAECELRVQAAVMEDAGVYTCVAVNDHGRAACSACVLVKGKTRIIISVHSERHFKAFQCCNILFWRTSILEDIWTTKLLFLNAFV